MDAKDKKKPKARNKKGVWDDVSPKFS